MRYTSATQGIQQCSSDMFLTNYISQGLGPPLTVKYLRNHILLHHYTVYRTVSKELLHSNCLKNNDFAEITGNQIHSASMSD